MARIVLLTGFDTLLVGPIGALSTIATGPFTTTVCFAAKTRLAAKLMVVWMGRKSTASGIGNTECWHPNCPFSTAVIFATGQNHALCTPC